MKITKDHISVTEASNIREICEPFFKSTGLTFFALVKYYKDGSWFSVNTNPNWFEYFTTNKELLKEGQHSFVGLSSGIYLWENHVPNVVKAAHEQCKIYHPVTLFELHDDYYESIYFSTNTNDRSILDFYFNNIQRLKMFRFYFKDQAEAIIRTADKQSNRFFSPCPKEIFNRRAVQDYMKHITIKKNHLYDCNNKYDINSLIGFSKSTDKVYLGEHFHDEYFTPREYDVFRCLLMGMTSKHIARALKFTTKTAEYHIDNIKRKLQCDYKSDIIIAAIQNGLVSISD